MNKGFSFGILLLFFSCSSAKTTREMVRSQETESEPNIASLSDKKNEQEEDDDSGLLATTITAEQVADEIGISLDKFRKETALLAKAILNKKTLNKLCDDETDNYSSSFCETVELYRGNEVDSDERRSSTGRRVPVRPNHFSAQQKFAFTRLLRSVHKNSTEQLMSWVPKLLETTSCPRNLSAASLRRLENALPSKKVFQYMEKLYDHAAACLRPDDEGYEITHFRQGLIRFMLGEKDKARLSLRRAAAADSPSERSRVLYWAGWMEQNLTKRAKYWGEVIEKYPLSFHALHIWNHMGVDPYEKFSKRPASQIARNSLGESDLIETSLRWLEMLYIQGHIDAAEKFSRWMAGHFKEQILPSTLVYLSSLKSAKGTPLNTITFLSRQISENPVMINQQTLKMLFPKPFFDTFEKASPNTDTFLILSIARQESGFNPKARSRANAQGLLQLLPSTARILTGKRRNNLYDSELNAELGVRYFSNLVNRVGSVELALAGYNAGPGRIGEWKSRFPTDDTLLFMDLIPFKETRNYVSSILRNNYWYERLYAQDPAILAGKALRSNQQRSEQVSRLIEGHTAIARAPAQMN